MIAYRSFTDAKSSTNDVESLNISVTDHRMDCAVCCKIAMELSEKLVGEINDLRANKI